MKLITSKNIVRFTDSISLKVKIIAVFFTFIILPLSVFTFIAYSRINHLVITQTLSSASQSFDECSSILQRYFTNMNTAMQNLLFDTDIYEIAAKDTRDYPPIQQLEDYNMLVKRFDYLRKGTDIDNIRFYLDTNTYYSENNINIFSLAKVIGKEWYERLLHTGQSRIWCQPSVLEDNAPASENFFSFASIIFNMNNLNQPLAVLRVDIQAEKIQRALKNAAITENSFVFISDGEKILFPEPGKEQVNLVKLLDTPVSQFVSDQWSFHKVNHQNYYSKAKRIDLTNWYVLAIVPENDNATLKNQMRNQMLLVLILIGTISYFLAYSISNSSLKRIFLLNRQMKKIEQGSLEASLKPVGKDEIGELMGSFNKMLARMAEMVDEKYKMGQEMKSAELRALQAQINPHFLYNSLDLINCLAIQHHIPEITQMVTSLARFYKLSLSQGHDVISLKDELNHMQLYVQIQNLRFENRIILSLDIADEIYEYSTLKTILQPIVENSIMHGIFEKDDKCGTIQINAQVENSVVFIEVTDDGVGIPEEMLQIILLEDKSSHRHGYGVKNTNDRMKLYYGQEYGLRYRSKLGQGTTVEIRFPAVKYS